MIIYVRRYRPLIYTLSIAAILIIIGVAGCERKRPVLKEPGQLTVIMRNAPTIYYEWHDEPEGFEYALVSDFAKQMGLQLNILDAESTEDALTLLESNKADFASAGIAITPELKKRFDFGPSYHEVFQWVACHKDKPKPEKVEDLYERYLVVAKATNHEERLRELQEEYPGLKFGVSYTENSETLLQQVSEGKIDCTVADSNILAVQRRYFPDILPAFKISEKQSLAWVMPADSFRLQQYIQEWFERYKALGNLTHLNHRYYSYTKRFDYFDITMFHKRVKTRLPKYIKYFKRAGEKYKIPWKLLAVQAYQESHWNPYAKSPTGVRGLMMLTMNTARQVGVVNRLNPKQSIYGGAKHLNWLIKVMSTENIHPEDRVKFALAAYNVGRGHVQDAMVLAKRMKKDPTRWKDISEVLPFLAKRKYYRKLKHGYARGWEPVTYVKNIMNYYDIIQTKDL